MSNVTALKTSISEAEWQMRKDLAACFRLVDLYGWSDLIATHLSARVPDADDQFLINPFGLTFDEMTASLLMKADEDGNLLNQSDYDMNPAGFVIHSAVHMARPEVACVIHTHTQAGVGVATQKNGLLPLTQQSLAVLATTSYHEYEGIAFDMSERERLAQDLGNNNVLFLKNHGLLTVGNTVGEAFMWMYRAERACRFQLAFQQAGVEATKISEEMQKITMDRNRQANSKDGYRPIGQKEWPALLRKLDRENPGYDA
ncbi:class II aldolase/adducin family protein [Rhodospirillales bacterium]|jgi:ribulose-5-phosphate 4-epimerase/fuculose-1-phosphate aldolase|nr:class II aldolase/adducin family protein [Rhodospirillales bacterium]